MKLKLALTALITLGFLAPAATYAMEEQPAAIEQTTPEKQEQVALWKYAVAVAYVAAVAYCCYYIYCEFRQALLNIHDRPLQFINQEDLQKARANFYEMQRNRGS